jgi:hypothetical protein
MKKVFALALCVAFAFALCSCGASSQASQPTATAKNAAPLSSDEFRAMFSDPSSYKGKTVQFYGKIFNGPEYNADTTAFQVWADPPADSMDAMIYVKSDTQQFSIGEYVKIDGVISGTLSSTNVFGASISAPTIDATSCTESTYQDAVSPTKKEIDVSYTQAQSQYGYNVAITKVELAASETRVYVTVRNGGASNFMLNTYTAKIVQNGNQIGQQSNYEAGYPEVESEIVPGATSSGIITFPAIQDAPFTLYIDGYSENWQESIKTITFKLNA